MTKIEVKTEIQKILDSVSEETLKEIFLLLKGLTDQPKDHLRLMANIRTILSEDKELLDKLAQ